MDKMDKKHHIFFILIKNAAIIRVKVFLSLYSINRFLNLSISHKP